MAKDKKEAKLDKMLIDVYKNNGIVYFLDVCAHLLDIKDKENFEKKKRVNGEVCEVVLRVLTKYYLEKNNIPGDVFGSVILKDVNNPKNDFRTELDIVILTPYVCLTGECKSFIGEIHVKDQCTLVRGDLTADVNKQSMLHGKHLKENLKPYVKEGLGLPEPPAELFCFLYCNGKLSDDRASNHKLKLPVLTITSLFSYYDKIFESYSKEVFDYERAKEFFKKSSTSKALHQQHRDYLDY